MDEKDIEIMYAISNLQTTSLDKIESETNIPKSTIHYRINQLIDEGIIENELYDIDPDKIGLEFTVISEVFGEYDEGYHQAIGEELSSIDGVTQVYFTMGETDFIVISHLPNRDMIENLINSFESIEEISRTSSKMVIKTIKNSKRPLCCYDLDDLINNIM